MDRKEKIRALQLIKDGMNAQQAVELAAMPEPLICLSQAEADQAKAKGYTGNIIILVDGETSVNT